MSLKAFHIIFIVASSALALGFGVWMLRDYSRPEGTLSDLLLGVGSCLAFVGLLVYGRYFLKKLKRVSYL